MEDTFGQLIFFSIFQVIGGAALGAGIRSVLQHDLTGVFFIIWGAGFGGIPALIGAVTFIGSGQAVYFYAQLFIFLTTIVTVMLLPRDFLQKEGQAGAESGAILGAIMAMVGGGVVLFNVRGGDWIALLVGGIFALLGAFLLIRSSISVLRSS